MFTKFWETIAEGAASEWNARILSHAFVFWCGGILAWISSNRWNWQPLIDLFTKINTEQGLTLIIVGLVLVVTSSSLMEWFELPLLRIIEGYWPCCKNLSAFLIERKKKDLEVKRKRWGILAKSYDDLCASQLEEYNRLDVELSTYPEDAASLLPTRLGNLLCAAEEYPNLRYGLDTIIVWPRLWLVLPENTGKDLYVARQNLNERTRFFAWSIAFSVWTPLAWWAFLLSIIGGVIAYRSLLLAASSYGDLLRAAFDIHRFALYEALRLPIPVPSDDECEHGKALSMYLKRGETPNIGKNPNESDSSYESHDAVQKLAEVLNETLENMYRK